MSHVTIIRPPVLFPKLRPSASVKSIPPLGMAYVAGTLRARGHEVVCIDAPGEALTEYRVCPLDSTLLENGLSHAEVLARIPARTEVIGLSCMFSIEWFSVLELIRAIRAEHPSAFIVLGGEHATADYEYILTTMPEVDACILGEGENKMLGLVQALAAGVERINLPGVALMVDGSVRKNSEGDGEYRILDIDAIPRPAWDLLPIDQYLDAGCGFNSLHSRAMPMLASRGCPHRCTFCSSPQMWTPRWKARDVEDVIDEIKHYVRRYQINRVEFYDLTTVIDKRWITVFCQRLIDEKIGISWGMPSGTRTEGLTPDVLRLIKESGCSQITYPLETGNPKVSARIKKNINYARSLASMRSAIEAGIDVKSNIIIGFPFEGYLDVFREYLFAIRLAWIGCHDVSLFNFAPYPGSELHEQLVAEGKIRKDASYPGLLRRVFQANFTNCQSWCPRIPGRVLQLLSLTGFAVFYSAQFLFRPHRLAKAIYRIAIGKPGTYLELGLTGMVTRFFKRRELARLT